LDVAGQDATEAFEDVGHSDEARETLEQLLVGKLKRNVKHAPPISAHFRRANVPLLQPGDPTPKAPMPGAVAPQAQTGAAGMGTVVYAVLFIGAAAAYYAYQYMQQQQQKQ
jgi:cytochrome b5